MTLVLVLLLCLLILGVGATAHLLWWALVIALALIVTHLVVHETRRR